MRLSSLDRVLKYLMALINRILAYLFQRKKLLLFISPFAKAFGFVIKVDETEVKRSEASPDDEESWESYYSDEVLRSLSPYIVSHTCVHNKAHYIRFHCRMIRHHKMSMAERLSLFQNVIVSLLTKEFLSEAPLCGDFILKKGSNS
jgi:hypothetical protein